MASSVSTLTANLRPSCGQTFRTPMRWPTTGVGRHWSTRLPVADIGHVAGGRPDSFGARSSPRRARRTGAVAIAAEPQLLVASALYPSFGRVTRRSPLAGRTPERAICAGAETRPSTRRASYPDVPGEQD